VTEGGTRSLAQGW